jgi:hypothetical protein
MRPAKFQVGMLVEHPARPQWGLGKIVAMDDERLYVVFMGDLAFKAKAFIRTIAPLSIAEKQTDTVLDTLPPAKLLEGSWELPRNYARLMLNAGAGQDGWAPAAENLAEAAAPRARPKRAPLRRGSAAPGAPRA